MATETLKLTVRNTVADHAAPICDGCIEKRRGYSEKTVNPISNALKKDGIFERTRNFEPCSVCGKYNFVNTIAARQ